MLRNVLVQDDCSCLQAAERLREFLSPACLTDEYPRQASKGSPIVVAFVLGKTCPRQNIYKLRQRYGNCLQVAIKVVAAAQDYQKVVRQQCLFCIQLAAPKFYRAICLCVIGLESIVLTFSSSYSCAGRGGVKRQTNAFSDSGTLSFFLFLFVCWRLSAATVIPRRSMSPLCPAVNPFARGPPILGPTWASKK